MVVRRSDARRRRLVIDPAVQSDAADSENPQPVAANSKRRKKPSAAGQADVRAYSYGADRRNQLKTTDLIPKRVLSYLLVVMAMLASLLLLNFSASHASQWRAQIGDAGLNALTIHGQGSLASWYSSFLLIITGLASIQIYALRQHRCDDYLGTYRLWIWMAVLFLIASVNCVVDLGGIATSLIQSLTAQSFSQRPWLLITIKLTALSLLVARGLYEVRKSRGSFALVAVVWVAYSVAAVMQLPAAKESLVNLGSEKVMGNCILFGTTALLLAHLTYARFIFLRAHGLITLRVKKKKAKSKKKLKVASSKKSKTKLAVESQKAAASKPKTKRAKTTQTKSKPVQESKTLNVVATKSKRVARKTATKTTAQTAAPVKAPPAEKPAETPKERTPSDVLKELAAASRAKAKLSESNSDLSDDTMDDGIIKLSKAQRRKQRKQNKQQNRRAA